MSLARRLIVLAAIVLFSNVRAAHAVCDVAGAASDLRAAREAIDAACPCAAAAAHAEHVACARPVVASRVDDGRLDRTCKSEALKHAKLSICGTPGAVVCCRVASDGKQSHKVFKTAAKCVDTSRYTACISGFPSVPTGCDANGCSQPPVCGNGIVENGEDCDPPDNGATCDQDCHALPCDLPVGCGNGTIDAGEQCDPPGVGSCGPDCQAAPCAPPLAGEIAVACVDGDASVGAGSNGTGYLVSWSGNFRPRTNDVLARRLDADGAPVDAGASVLSGDGPCATSSYGPAVGSDGSGYLVAWSAYTFMEFIYARTLGGGGAVGTRDELASMFSIGQCRSGIGGPMAVSSAAPATFAALWQEFAACVFTPVFQDPDGVLLTYGATPARTSLAVGFGIAHVPGNLSATAASAASLGTDTLAVWHADAVPQSQPPFTPVPFVAATWIDLDGTTMPFSLGSRRSGIASLRPGVAAGAASFLVAWAQGATDAAVDPTEIRGLRVTRAAGPLDADGGVVLTTTAGGVVRGGPVAAYDGSLWRVAWTESAAGGDDLRVVAVDASGTAGIPQLVASGLGDGDPAIASAGDGRALVIYVRPDGTAKAIRATLVSGP